MRYLIATAIALLASLSAMPQSGYGWFTGKAMVFTCPGHNAGFSLQYYYNIADRLSAGTGTGLRAVCGHSGVVVPLTAAIKVGLTDRKPPVMPVIEILDGYAAGKTGYTGFYAEERIGIETTKIARIRFAMGVGCAHIHNSKSCFSISAGILF